MYIFGGHDIKEGSLDSLWGLELGKMSDIDKVGGNEFGEQATEKKAQWQKIEAFGTIRPGNIILKL
jgi:hypothetical protein